MSRVHVIAALSLAVALVSFRSAAAADEYKIDPDHTSVYFKISHLGLCSVHGRFNEIDGVARIDDDDPSKSSFLLTIPVSSIDTKVKQRDDHLRSADFFDVEKHPDMSFKSTKVERSEKGLKVTGDYTLRGVTKPLTIELIGGKTAEFPPGVQRVGYSTSFTLKRSDFDMKTMLGPIGDEVHVEISFQGIRQ